MATHMLKEVAISWKSRFGQYSANCSLDTLLVTEFGGFARTGIFYIQDFVLIGLAPLRSFFI